MDKGLSGLADHRRAPSDSSRLVMDLLLDQFEFTYRHFLKVSISVRALQRKAKYKANSKLLRQIPE
ncbi:hypothetical protein V8V91_25470 [Algoriphagus halophilus]|uniref:hypothetical protein n=1 Tax=Algoriphagus halophilus TaxID=226505 RepID=UPI00358FA5B0